MDNIYAQLKHKKGKNNPWSTMKEITMQGGAERSLGPTGEAATSSPGRKTREGRDWGELPTRSGLSVEGRPRGEGDPRVAYRSQGGAG